MPNCPTCGRPTETLDYLQVHLDLNLATYRGESIRLTPQQSEILHALYENSGVLVAREKLFGLIWKTDRPLDQDGVLKVQVCKMRKKLAKWPFNIESIWGKGYSLARRAA